MVTNKLCGAVYHNYDSVYKLWLNMCILDNQLNAGDIAVSVCNAFSVIRA